MAFTPEQEAKLMAILNGVMGAGFNNEAQWTQAMTHVKLQNELNKLRSEYNNLVDEVREYNDAANATLEAKQAEINTKEEEIKAFIANLS